MSYQIAIPSYERAEILRDKTLAWLASTDVPFDRVTVFVADGDEQAEYQQVLQRSDLPPVELVVAEKGLMNARNFIQTYYREGTNVVQMDDDLKGIFTAPDKKRLVPMEQVDDFLASAFSMCERGRMRLWGIYPVFNPYFMKPNITTDLRLISGGFFGLKISHSPELLLSTDSKEDYERTILYYLADGGVLRFNFVAMDTKVYEGTGGMGPQRTPEIQEKAVQYLIGRWPELVSRKPEQKSGWPEIKLKDKRKIR